LSVFVHFQLSCEISALFACFPGKIQELCKKEALNRLIKPDLDKIRAFTTLTYIIKTDKHDK